MHPSDKIANQTRKRKSSNRSSHLSTRLREQLAGDASLDLNALFPHPASDLSQRGKGGSERYIKEFIYQALHQLLMSGTPLTVIAGKFDVDVRTIHLWKNRLLDRYREDARHIEPGALVGEILENYRVLIATATRPILEGAGDFATQRASLLLALKAQADMVEFLHSVGLIGTNPKTSTI
ncbi:MAG: hypothetical protein JWR80_475 [Bradyrhizobium sp.]|nr:hypothetical protein [Bradyrhizobium sp.]